MLGACFVGVVGTEMTSIYRGREMDGERSIGFV